MKKILFLLAVAALAAGCAPEPSENTDSQNQPDSQTQLYKNSSYGYQFEYPKSFSFGSPSYGNLQDKVAHIQIGKEAYPGTNLSDASFSVSAEYAKDLNACLKLNSSENAEEFKETKNINGVTFYAASGTGAAAGNRYDSRVYRSYNGTNLCTELVETIHTTSVGNYEPGTITEVNKDPIWQMLEDITNSFRFTNTK